MRGKFLKIFYFIITSIILFTFISQAVAGGFWGLQVFPNTLFFSIEMLEVNRFKNAFKVSVDKKGKLHYSFNPKIADASIHAVAYLDNKGLVISVFNRTKKPVKINYFLDEFYLITKDGSIYELEKPNILDYPSSPINPNKCKIFIFKQDIPASQTEYIVAILCKSVLIFMKRIE